MTNKTDIDEKQICDYLTHHPDFLIKHPYVLLELELQGQSDGLPNLALQQQRLLREENARLKQQIKAMSQCALENEQVFKLLSECQRQLWHCHSFTELASHLADTLVRAPYVISCELTPYECKLDDIISRRLAQTGVYLGRLSSQERELLWQQPDNVQSVALYLIGDVQKPEALLAFASSSAEHFAPSNDNLFMQEFITSLQLRLSALA